MQETAWRFKSSPGHQTIFTVSPSWSDPACDFCLSDSLLSKQTVRMVNIQSRYSFIVSQIAWAALVGMAAANFLAHTATFAAEPTHADPGVNAATTIPSPPFLLPSEENLQADLDAGEYDAVIEMAERHIKARSSRFDRYNPDLIMPLQARAEALYQQGEFDASITGFLQANQVLRINEGLNSEKQIALYHRLADAHSALRQAVETNDFEEAALSAAERAFGATNVALLEPLDRLGSWYLKAGYFSSARALFFRAKKIAADNPDVASDHYAHCLGRIADSYVAEAFPNFDRASNAYYSQFKPASIREQKRYIGMDALIEVSKSSAFSKFNGGEKALLEQTEVLRAQFDELQARPGEAGDEKAQQAKSKLIAALLELGDWYVRFRERRDALEAFRQAKELMTESEARLEFAAPKLLFMPLIDDPTNCAGEQCLELEHKPADDLLEGEVQFMVQLSNHGTVQRVTKRSSSPEDFVVFRYKSETRRARYRPAVIDGRFEDRRVVPVVHKFRYSPDLADSLSRYRTAAARPKQATQAPEGVIATD